MESAAFFCSSSVNVILFNIFFILKFKFVLMLGEYIWLVLLTLFATQTTKKDKDMAVNNFNQLKLNTLLLIHHISNFNTMNWAFKNNAFSTKKSWSSALQFQYYLFISQMTPVMIISIIFKFTGSIAQSHIILESTPSNTKQE